MNKVVDLVARRRLAERALATATPGIAELARPRLERLADAAFVAYLSAPAGYGKTVLLRSWESQWRRAGVRTAWATLTEAERAPEKLIRRLCAALQPDAPEAAPSRVPRGKRNSQERCADIGRLVASQSCALVVDDAHQLRGSAGETLLRQIIAHRPPSLRIAVATRGPLALDLSRLKLNDAVVDIDAAQLRFDSQEIRSILAAHACAASENAAAELMRATEGWPALVTLGIQTLSRSDVEATRLLKRLPRPWESARDYLDEQLLSGLHPSVAAFIGAIGPLGRFSTAFATAVLGHVPTECTTRQIDSLGLPITRDAEDEDWRVLHPMFASFLEERLRADAPGRLLELHRAAAHWYADHDRLSDAVRSAFASNDASFAGELLARASAARKRIGRFRKFASWAMQLPSEVLDRYPTLRIEAACTHAALFEHEAARLYADPVRLRFDDLPLTARDDLHAVDAVIAIYADRPEAALETGLRGLRECQGHDPYTMGTLRLAAAYGWMAKGAHESARQAIVAARADHEQARSAFGTACAYALSGLWHATRGRLGEAASDWNEADKTIQSLADSEIIEAVAVGYLPETLYEWNDLAGAEEVLRRCLDSSMEIALPDMVTCMFLTAARAAAARNELDRAREVLDAAEVAGLRRGWPRLVHAIAWERVRFALQRGELQEARRLHALLQREGEFQEPTGFAPHCTETEANLVGALRLEIALRPSLAVLSRIRAAIAQATSQERIWRLVRLLTLEARAHDALGNRAAALRSLRRALEYGAAGRMVRSFVDEGRVIVELVEAVLAEERRAPMTIAIDYLEQIVTAAGRVPGAAVAASCGIDQLSKRELEVLRMLVAGLSNSDIGARLFVSQHTVKWHLQHVYEKLGVRSRTQAIAAARAARLMEQQT
jgi:LuxR family maltose regulon positive regulatory protein